MTTPMPRAVTSSTTRSSQARSWVSLAGWTRAQEKTPRVTVLTPSRSRASRSAARISVGHCSGLYRHRTTATTGRRRAIEAAVSTVHLPQDAANVSNTLPTMARPDHSFPGSTGRGRLTYAFEPMRITTPPPSTGRLAGRAPTLHDIAEHAGVSIRTVSRVVNDRPGPAATPAARVLESIEHLGYRPNLLARGLVTRRASRSGWLPPT